VILSWQAIEWDLQMQQQGHNVIVHELAHKLDMLNGGANGVPTLHSQIQGTQWTTAFREAYQQLNQRLEHHQRVCINPYAATSPAEFFAVFSEYFFVLQTFEIFTLQMFTNSFDFIIGKIPCVA
jgi:Mlc titration factor MtfA (ptsG expression regulator)